MSTPDDTETDDNNLNNTSYNTDSTDNVTEQDSDSDTITGAATDTEQSGEESLTDESDNTSPQPESGNDARNKTFENSTTHPKVKKLDTRLRCFRGGGATYVDEFGYIKIASYNTPRFDHDPITKECKGLLIEPSRENKISYSPY